MKTYLNLWNKSNDKTKEYVDKPGVYKELNLGAIKNSDKSLTELISKFSYNRVLSEIYLKIIAINSLYSTNIYVSGHCRTTQQHRHKMNKQAFSKTNLDDILTELKYYDNFKNKYLNKSFDKINYGKRIGELEFSNFFDAAKRYTYSNQISDEVFQNWNKVLNDKISTEEEIFCAVLEVFVWGDVLNGNVKKAVELYKSKKLSKYIRQVIDLLGKKEIILKTNKNDPNKNNEIELIWSSGWTKVYSFINNDILIYDSRVSAFLNHTLTYDIDYNEEQLKELKKLTTYLFNFQGAENRERLVDKKRFGFKNSNPNGVNGLNANLVSSWIIELLKDKLKLQEELRLFERAFFMLGFDLKQIKGQHND